MKLVLAGLVVLGVLSSSAAFAAMSKPERTTFIGQCQKQMYMSQPECSCMADIADKSLDDQAVAYLSLDALDVTRSAALSKSMTAKEVASIDKFMRTAPGQCKGAK